MTEERPAYDAESADWVRVDRRVLVEILGMTAEYLDRTEEYEASNRAYHMQRAVTSSQRDTISSDDWAVNPHEDDKPR